MSLNRHVEAASKTHTRIHAKANVGKKHPRGTDWMAYIGGWNLKGNASHRQEKSTLERSRNQKTCTVWTTTANMLQQIAMNRNGFMNRSRGLTIASWANAKDSYKKEVMCNSDWSAHGHPRRCRRPTMKNTATMNAIGTKPSSSSINAKHVCRPSKKTTSSHSGKLS